MGTVFIGRDRERAQLVAGLHHTFAGHGGIFLVAGEPGVGKTTLARALGETAAARGARVVWGRCWEGAAPYWMWSQVIRGLLDDFDDRTRRSLRAEGMPYLARLVPELADRIGQEASEGPGAPDSDAARFYLFEAIASFLKRTSSLQPLVLLLDDVLDGDRGSLLLLRFLAREIAAARVMVVATYRSIDEARSPEAIDLLPDLVRDGQLVRLREMDREETGQLIASIAGVVPWRDKAAAIHEATGGNPLFIREVTRLLATEDSLDRPGTLSIPVPDGLRAVIRRRLLSLSADAVRVLSAAAVIGRDFDLVLVGVTAELPPRAVLTAVAESAALGLVAAAAESPGVYRFSHPVIREAVYEGLPLATRTEIHHRVAEGIERLHGTDSPSHLGALAYHFAQVAALGRSDKAGEYALRAGDRAMETFAYEEGIRQYRRALDALALSGGADPSQRCELLLRLGRAHARAGEYADAKANFLLAAEIARHRGKPEQLASAALGIGEQVIQGGLVDRQLLAVLQEALDHLSPADSALRVRLLARLSLELTFSQEGNGESPTEPRSLAAIEMARRLDDRSALVDALRARWMARWGPDGLEERVTLAEELLAIARETGDRATELIGRAQRTTCSLESGEITAADQDIAVHGRLAAELRMAYHEWAAATMRAGRALLAGSLDDVEALMEDARGRLSGASNASLAYLNQISVLRWEQGRLGELRGDWQHVVQSTPQLAFARAWLCLALASASEDESARRYLAELTRDIPRVPRDGLWLLAISLASLAAANLEDDDAATVLYPLLLPHAQHVVVLPMLHPALCLGSVSFYLGILAARVRSGEEVESHFDDAIRANQRLGAKPFLARAHCERARMLIGQGRAADRGRILEDLDRAAALAHVSELPRLSETIETLRAAAGDTRSTDDVQAEPEETARSGQQVVSASAQAAIDVFRREGEFWTLIHDGLTVRLPDAKGLRCLARLLANPGQEFLAIDLESADARRVVPMTVPVGVAAAEVVSRRDLGDAGELLDPEAKAAYKTRLDELRADVEEADRFNDLARAARVREEMEFLTSELARAVGLGGRDRRAASHTERARLNVTRAIRSVLRTLERVHPSLARHLSLAIRTGRYCSYTPDPRVPIVWETNPPRPH